MASTPPYSTTITGTDPDTSSPSPPKKRKGLLKEVVRSTGVECCQLVKVIQNEYYWKQQLANLAPDFAERALKDIYRNKFASDVWNHSAIKAKKFDHYGTWGDFHDVHSVLLERFQFWTLDACTETQIQFELDHTLLLQQKIPAHPAERWKEDHYRYLYEHFKSVEEMATYFLKHPKRHHIHDFSVNTDHLQRAYCYKIVVRFPGVSKWNVYKAWIREPNGKDTGQRILVAPVMKLVHMVIRDVDLDACSIVNTLISYGLLVAIRFCYRTPPVLFQELNPDDETTESPAKDTEQYRLTVDHELFCNDILDI